MEGFKKIAKMQCFKEGGSVQKQIANYEKRERKTEEKADEAQDKKIVKKAFSIHDTQQHEEKTNLQGLKKGGRAKKAQGTVKKYKTGGTVENQYAAKKTDKDIKDIANAKRQKPAMLCGGGKAMKKYAAGGEVTNPQALVDKIAQQENADDASLLPRTAKRIGRGIKRGLKNIGDMVRGEQAPAPTPAADFGTESVDSLRKMGQGMGVTGQKKGGKVKGGKACK